MSRVSRFWERVPSGVKTTILPVVVLLAGYIGYSEYKDWRKSVALQARLAAQKERREADKPSGGMIEFPPMLGQDAVAVTPAPGQNPEVERALARTHLWKPPVMPEVTGDILGQLGMKIENEFDGKFGVTDEAIRGAADYSYDRLGIADDELRSGGWTLTIRPNQGGQGASTQVKADKKHIWININPPDLGWALSHEMTHALCGSVSEDMMLPGFAGEFLAEAAEDPAQFTRKIPWSYEELNKPILGLSRSLAGWDGQIGQNAPLDVERYELMRLAAYQIGPEKHQEIAKKLYAMAKSSSEPLSMADVKPVFEEAGLEDLVLFTETLDEGTYLDVAIMNEGPLYIMYKQVDSRGIESSTPANLGITWRTGKEPLANMNLSTNPGGSTVDDAAFTLAPWADTIEVTLGTKTWTYKINGTTLVEDNASGAAVAHAL